MRILANANRVQNALYDIKSAPVGETLQSKHQINDLIKRSRCANESTIRLTAKQITDLIPALSNRSTQRNSMCSSLLPILLSFIPHTTLSQSNLTLEEV
jgi:hypothetical protein